MDNTTDVSTMDLDEVSGGAKQYPPAIQSQLEAAKKFIANDGDTFDKARVGKGNTVQVHFPGDEGERGVWESFADAKKTLP